MVKRSLAIICTCVLIAVDQIIKFISHAMPKGTRKDLFFGIKFAHIENTGALWSFGSGFNIVFILASFIAFALIYVYRNELGTMSPIIIPVLVAGVTGNLIDRIIHGVVIDWFWLSWWPTFNLADVYLNIGVWLSVALWIKESLIKNSS